jgi:hypothetical protein
MVVEVVEVREAGHGKDLGGSRVVCQPVTFRRRYCWRSAQSSTPVSRE